MTDYEIVQIALSISEQIDFLWNFYVTACAVFLGWLFSTKIEWDADKQRSVIILFLMFAAVNLSAIYNEYSLFEIALDSIRSNLNHNGNSFIKAFSDSSGIGSLGAVVVHLAGDFFIYSLIRKSFRK
jgi:hypothetical protein